MTWMLWSPLAVTSFGTAGPVIWAFGLILFTCFLFLMLSRTPPSEPMRKCVLLSLCAHALLALYATTVPYIPILDLTRITNPFSDQRISITRIEGAPSGEGETSTIAAASPNQTRKSFAPWDDVPHGDAPRATPAELPRAAAGAASNVARRDLHSVPSTALVPANSFSADEAAAVAMEAASAPTREKTDAARVDPAVVTPAPQTSVAATPTNAPRETSADVAATKPPAPVPSAMELPSAEAQPRPAPTETAPRPETDIPTGAIAASAPPIERAAPSDAATSIPRASPADLTALPRVRPNNADFAPAGATDVRRAASEGALPPSAAMASSNPALPPLDAGAPAPLTRRNRTNVNEVPDVYKLRMEQKRPEVLEELGASRETEAAVQRALAWLASAQSADGRWDALRYGAGQERNVNGRDRNGAGASSDCGVTGLALLAFLGAGQTHQSGEYRDVVRRAVHFLVSRQTADGCLAGDATFYEFMYCHAMAAFALSECYALTGDPTLEIPVRRAISYTIYAQDPRGGSWRYRPGDPGDTSVLGWQIMALESAQVGGIPIPRATRDGVQHYLASVAQGRFGGKAGYRPGEPPTRTMTAEALVCRQFLDIPISEAAQREAAEFLITELPGSGEVNDYYWYYASLALHERGGPEWDRWNEALQKTLIPTQRQDGTMAGSFDPRGTWGGHGGRVYSTAVAVLCLEVYYRYQHRRPETRPVPIRQAERGR